MLVSMAVGPGGSTGVQPPGGGVQLVLALRPVAKYNTISLNFQCGRQRNRYYT